VLTIPRIIVLAAVLCLYGTAWSWLDRDGDRGIELWKMRLLFLAIALAVLLPVFGYPHSHLTKAQEEATSEISADEASEHAGGP
jgi:heme/copper-type cytochrome/quinol oxidase subunit 2